MCKRWLFALRRCAAVLLLLLPMAADCLAQGIDHRVNPNTSGIWNPDIYRSLTLAMTAGQIGLALWEGGESRLGDTAWRGIDSEIIGVISAEGLKHITTRVRPSHTEDPGLWFQGGSNRSFPSGEAAHITAIVTPYILEYGHDYPAVYALSLLPVYVGVGRVKTQSHWQTDVIGGWLVGGLAGWYAHEREKPLVLSVMPHGVFVGLKKAF